MAVELQRGGAPRLGVFDTAIASDNLGDEIIMEAVEEVIGEVFGRQAEPIRIATHSYMPRAAYAQLAQMDIGIVGGTNILKSHMFVRANWRLRPYDIFFVRNAVLLGAGWQQYQGAVDIFSNVLFKCILSGRYLHSVRDTYTLANMQRQVKRVAYTACPTMWPLTAERCAAVPTGKAPAAILSLTCYRPDPADAELLRLLLREYGKVHFWCQMEADAAYLASLAPDAQLPVIRDLASYDRLLEGGQVDVIGTRLHGGIRALQHGCRALILSVDNRAAELARDTNMPVIERHDLSGIAGWIRRSPPLAIRLPWDAINEWKTQFARI